MAFTKPDLTRVWASGAPGANIVDPDTADPGKYAAGWLAEVPPFEYFNYIQQNVTQGLGHINEQGVASWDNSTVYPAGALVKGSDGRLFKALIEQNANDPVVDTGVNWVKVTVNLEPSSAAKMVIIPPSSVLDGDRISLNYYAVDADNGGGPFRVTKSAITPDAVVHFAFDSDPTGASGGFIRTGFTLLTPEMAGASGDGLADDSSEVIAAAAYKFELLPDKTYLYTSANNFTLANLINLNGGDIVGHSNVSAITSRHDSKFVGLKHNHTEEKYLAVPMAAVTSGSLVSPPISTASQGSIDVLAHWYNDFGLDSTRQADGGLGSVKWYTWEWNHTDTVYAEGYLPDRHPEIGFYRGDDPVVLDWICYGLREAGVTAVNLIGSGADFTNWTTADDGDYWKYQLFTNVPNFKGLKYVIPMLTPGVIDLATAKAKFDEIFDNVINVYDNYYTVNRDGKNYVMFFFFDGGSYKAALDGAGPAPNFKALMAYAAGRCQTLGLGIDGAAFLARNPNSTDFILNRDGVSDGWVYIAGDYANVFGTTTTTTYDDLVSTFGASVPVDFEVQVPNVMPSRESHSFHPSTLSSSGHTPDKFYNMVNKAVNLVQADPHLYPNLITVGNVSEWAEQGPGLMPNVQDGWGYLDALRRGVTGGRTKIATTMQDQTVIVSDTISSKSPVVRISGASSFSFTSTPTIEAGVRDGQELVIIAGGGFTYTLQDEGTLPGSNVEINGAATLPMAATAAYKFIWDASLVRWLQIG